MGLMDGVKGLMAKWLGIIPAQSQVNIQIRENSTRELNTLKNQLWYRGDPSELEQFFKQAATLSIDGYTSSAAARFWAASPNNNLLIRKMHSGLPRMIVDKLAEIVVQDMMEPNGDTSATSRWNSYAETEDFAELLKEAIVSTLSEGDGAFKVCVDPDLSNRPLIEFYSGNNVDFMYKRRKLIEIIFYTDCFDNNNKHYKLVEHYGKGYVHYKLLNDMGHECAMGCCESTQDLVDVTFDGDFIMGVPLKFNKSAKWADRGESKFEGKTDVFDAFDECLSTWMDALRAGRVKQYIPESIVPRNAETGEPLTPDVFNPYIAIGASLNEDMKATIEVKQGEINYQGLLTTYMTLLDNCLQGLISPSTLGIDVKKLDNAESQREKEKTTLYTRDSIVTVLSKVLPKLVDVVLKTEDTMNQKQVGDDYSITFEWGQYASPAFDAVVETVGKAKGYGIMSIEKCVDELYGDSMSEEDKKEEVERIRAEDSLMSEEPAVNDDIMDGEDDAE